MRRPGFIHVVLISTTTAKKLAKAVDTRHIGALQFKYLLIVVIMKKGGTRRFERLPSCERSMAYGRQQYLQRDRPADIYR